MSALRPASEQDLAAMATVFIAAWRAGYRGVVPDEVIDALDHAEVLADLAANPHGRTTTVAVDDSGQVIGFVRVGDSDIDETGYVASLYVHPSASGAGVGTRLLRHALDTMPARDVTLWVFAGNARARRFYERAGFVPDGAELTDPRWRALQVRYRRRYTG